MEENRSNAADIFRFIASWATPTWLNMTIKHFHISSTFFIEFDIIVRNSIPNDTEFCDSRTILGQRWSCVMNAGMSGCFSNSDNADNTSHDKAIDNLLKIFSKFIRTRAPWRAKTDDMRLVVYQPMKNKCSFSPLGVRHISRVTGICLSLRK